MVTDISGIKPILKRVMPGHFLKVVKEMWEALDERQ
jgi:hypothetical protein